MRTTLHIACGWSARSTLSSATPRVCSILEAQHRALSTPNRAWPHGQAGVPNARLSSRAGILGRIPLLQPLEPRADATVMVTERSERPRQA
jgi:hypothetical protein